MASESSTNDDLSFLDPHSDSDSSESTPELSPAAAAALKRRTVKSVSDMTLHEYRQMTRKRVRDTDTVKWGEIEERELTETELRDLKLLRMRHVLSKDSYRNKTQLEGAQLQGKRARVQFGVTVVPAMAGSNMQRTRKERGRTIFEEVMKDQAVHQHVEKITDKVRAANAVGRKGDREHQKLKRARGPKKARR